MRRLAPVLCGLILTAGLATPGTAQTQLAFRIGFTDKAGSPPVSAASTFLSSRALQRRAAQGIAVDSTDRPVSPAYIDSVVTITGGKLHVTSRWLNQCVILVTDSADMLLLAGKPYISSSAYVGYFIGGLHKPSDANKVKEEILQPAPTGTTAGKTTGDPAFYGATWNQTEMVHGEYLHDLGYTGAGRIIAVLDGGFANADNHSMFDSLNNSGRILETKNFHRDTGSVYRYSLHGTLVLSTMAGYAPGSYVGAAPDASYALYITEDEQGEQPVEMDNMVAGMERADSLGADVVHTSLGYNQFVGAISFTYPKSVLNGHSTIPAIAANMGTAKGMVMVCSAGNEGGNSWDYLLTPSDADSMLTVGAVAGNRQPWANSSPGYNASGRVKPDVCAQGAPAAVAGFGNNINLSAGTSFSAPQIAGYAACLLQAAPNATPYRIRTAIQKSADRYTAPTPKLGYGIPDFRLALSGVGVRDTRGKAGFIGIYPNPAQGAVQLSWNAAGRGPVTIEILDFEGRIILRSTAAVQTAGLQQLALDLPATAAPGMYVVRIISAEGVFAQRFLRN